MKNESQNVFFVMVAEFAREGVFRLKAQKNAGMLT